VLPLAAAYERAELVQLAKLVPPRAEAKDWQAFLTDTRQWAEYSVKMGESAQAGQFNAEMPLFKLTQHTHERLAAIARHAGFKECALL
jgi:hypothetical protein